MDPQHALPFVYYRNGMEVVFRYQTGNVFLVRFRFHGNHIVFHDIVQGIIILGHQQFPERGRPHQLLLFIEHIEDIDFLRLGRNLFHLFQSLAHCKRTAHGNVFGGHDPTGRTFPIAQEVTDHFLVAGFHQLDQFLPPVGGHVPQDIHDIVFGHVLEDPDDLVQVEQFHDPDLELIISLFDDLGHLLVRQNRGQEHDIAVAGFFQGISQVDGVGIFHQFQYTVFIFSVQGRNQFILYPFFQFFLFCFYRMVLFLFIHA